MATYSDYNKQISDPLNQEPTQRQNFQTGLESQYGLPARRADLESIRRSAMETDKLLANLPTQLKQRTSGMLMTSGQLGRQQAAESAPLANTLANLNRGESVAQQGISSIQDMINRALAQRNLEQGNIVSELQKQRDYAFAQEQANAARAASGGGGGGGWGGLDYGIGTETPTEDYTDYEAQLQDELNMMINKANPARDGSTGTTVGTTATGSGGLDIMDRLRALWGLGQATSPLSYLQGLPQSERIAAIKRAFPEYQGARRFVQNIIPTVQQTGKKIGQKIVSTIKPSTKPTQPVKTNKSEAKTSKSTSRGGAR